MTEKSPQTQAPPAPVGVTNPAENMRAEIGDTPPRPPPPPPPPAAPPPAPSAA